MAERGNKREMRLEGQEALELYVEEIGRQLKTMMAQARELQAAIEEMRDRLQDGAAEPGTDSPAKHAPIVGKGSGPRD